MLDVASIAFNKPWCTAEQIRLFGKYLLDDHRLTIFDNSADPKAAEEIAAICAETGTRYIRLTPPQRLHHLALNIAASIMSGESAPYYGWVDHDIFPTCETRVIPLVDPAGFFALSQRHHATQRMYPWPGFFFVSREWLAGRGMNFDGIRANDKKDDGDTGSGLWHLFTEEGWDTIPKISHGYQSIRPSDAYGLQSHSVERIGDWLHFSNASGWLQIPKPEEREAILRGILAEL